MIRFGHRTFIERHGKMVRLTGSRGGCDKSREFEYRRHFCSLKELAAAKNPDPNAPELLPRHSRKKHTPNDKLRHIRQMRDQVRRNANFILGYMEMHINECDDCRHEFANHAREPKKVAA